MAEDEIDLDFSNLPDELLNGTISALADSMTIPSQWHVFPVMAGGKQPWGGLSWDKVSKPRPDWGDQWPDDVNIGIDCGKSGLIVVDEDEPDAVERWLGYVPRTFTVQTAKGRHFYFYAMGARLKNRVRLAPGIDIRSEGGYVVGPGSVHETGAKYVVLVDSPVQPVPPEIRDHGKKDTEIDLDLTEAGRFERLDAIPDGERGDYLFRYACSLAARSMRDDERLDLLKLEYAKCTPAYRDRTPEAMLQQAIKYHRDHNPDAEDEKPGVFAMLDIIGLLDPNRPPRKWLWEGMIPEGESASFVAPAGEGKSLLVLALVMAGLLGKGEFIGRPLGWEAGRKVLYVDMENSEDDWAERLPDLGLTQDSAGAILGKTLYPFSMPPLHGLDSAKGGKELLGLIDACGLGPGDVVVLDSTQRVTEGDENLNDTMRALYRHTSTALKRRGLTVIRTDNTGKDKDKGARGASAKRDDVGVSLILRPDDKLPNTWSLKQDKRRFAGAKEGVLTFSREGGNGDGRLRFVEAKGTTFGDHAQEVRDLLDHLGVEVDAGQRKAWDAVTKAVDEGLMVKPEWMSSRLVMKVQSERREMPVLVDCDGQCDGSDPSHPDCDGL